MCKSDLWNSFFKGISNVIQIKHGLDYLEQVVNESLHEHFKTLKYSLFIYITSQITLQVKLIDT